jgi:hypothetical protein
LKGRPLAVRAALVLLYLAGAAAWNVILSAEPARLSGPLASVEDWPKEFRYYTVLQQAVTEGRLPLYVSRPILAGRKLLAIPEMNWTPPLLLLRAVSVPRYILADTLLWYTAGFAGLLLLRRRHGLGLLPFTLLFLVFFFNGHLVAHFAAGHSMWAAHFALPFFALGVLALLQGETRAPALIALVMFAILLRGGIHLFAWCVLFLLLLAAFNPGRARPTMLALGAAVVMGALRLAPAVFLAQHWHAAFLSGFPSLRDFMAALVVIRNAAVPERGGVFGQLAWWEYDTYVGPVGLALLLAGGLALVRRVPALPARAERGLHGPMAVMAALSLGDNFLLFNLLPIPPLNGERVGARLLLLPLLFLATLAALRWQRWLETPGGARRARLARAAGAAALAGTATGLAAHAWAWRVRAVAALRPPRRALMNVQLAAAPSPLAGGDLGYVIVVAASTAVSLAALALVVAWLLRQGRPATAPAVPPRMR